MSYRKDGGAHEKVKYLSANPPRRLTRIEKRLTVTRWVVFVQLCEVASIDPIPCNETRIHSAAHKPKNSKTNQEEDTMPRTNADKDKIRPFQVNVPEAELTELRRRINATKWPERETVPDASQGVQLSTIQKLAR